MQTLLHSAKTVLRWSMLILLQLCNFSESSGAGGCEPAGNGAWRSLRLAGIGHGMTPRWVARILIYPSPLHLAPPPLALRGGTRKQTTEDPPQSKERDGESKLQVAKNQTSTAPTESQKRSGKPALREAKSFTASRKARNQTASALSGEKCTEQRTKRTRQRIPLDAKNKTAPALNGVALNWIWPTYPQSPFSLKWIWPIDANAALQYLTMLQPNEVSGASESFAPSRLFPSGVTSV